MDCVAGQGLILHGDNWFASLNTLLKIKQQGNYFVGLIKTGHSGIPVKHLRSDFSAQSLRGETRTVHLGDGADRIYAHAWNEPGWKAGKPPRKAQKVWIANCYSSATVSAWDKPRTFLAADNTVQHGYVSVPQTHVIREYFRAANRIDIHNQYRQGILAIERTWKTKSWELRIFQSVMGMILVNAYLAYKHVTKQDPTLREFTNRVALAMCAKPGEQGSCPIASSTRRAQADAMDAVKRRADQGDIPHALFSGRALGLGGTGGEGACRTCGDKHASGICKTCSVGHETAKPKPFWLCFPGKHGRQCYCKHMHDATKP